MVLIGPAIEALPYFIYTFTETRPHGPREQTRQIRFVKVDLLQGKEALRIYDGSTQTLSSYPPAERTGSHREDGQANTVTLHFLTPLRLKVKGDLATRLTFPLFFDRLAQRLTLLTAFYNPGATLPDFAPLLYLAPNVAVTSDELHWYDWERYSARQKETMKFGGLKGRIALSGELGPFMPSLRLGRQVNVGQSTSFGLGRYTVT